MELYAEQGFEQTTASDIAERAGVTERTFFRYFADKREVLFFGAGDLQDFVLAAIAASPATMKPMETVSAAMEGVADLLADREFSRRRAAVIAANPGLQERELLKMATLAGAAAEALRERGVPDPVAGLAAETGVTVFRIGFETWIGEGAPESFAECIREALDQLRSLTAGA